MPRRLWILQALTQSLLTQSPLRRPEPEQVLNQVRLWAVQVAPEHPGLERGGLFGSAMAAALQRDSRWWWQR